MATMDEDNNTEKVLSYTNEEPEYECMYCGARHVGRGMKNHIRWSSDKDHGPRGEVPDNYDLDKCERVGGSNVYVSRKQPSPQHSRYICSHCGKVYKGKRGLGVHIARTNDGLHTADDTDAVDYEEHMLLPADDNVVWVPDEAYKSLIDLTEDEIEDGWEVNVDESLSTGGTLVESTVVPNKEIALNQFREELLTYLEQDEKISPMEAYRMFERKIRSLPDH